MLGNNPRRINQPFILDAIEIELGMIPLQSLPTTPTVISGPIMQTAGQVWPMPEGSFISRTEQAGQLYPVGY